jgi:hypothetical protein
VLLSRTPFSPGNVRQQRLQVGALDLVAFTLQIGGAAGCRAARALGFRHAILQGRDRAKSAQCGARGLDFLPHAVEVRAERHHAEEPDQRRRQQQQQDGGELSNGSCQRPHHFFSSFSAAAGSPPA